MRTKQEVIKFLESKVGTKVPCVGNPSLDGQCVTLIKALLEFLGAPNPYKARGHANTCISAYLNEGIAKKGAGFLSVFSNKNMAENYGHVWCNAGDGAGTFYESNGAKPLIVTKGKTYSYDNICNLDQYISENIAESTKMMQIDEATFNKLVKNSASLDAIADHLKVERNADGNKYIEAIKAQVRVETKTVEKIVEKIVEKPVEVIKEVIKEVKVNSLTDQAKEMLAKIDKMTPNGGEKILTGDVLSLKLNYRT